MTQKVNGVEVKSVRESFVLNAKTLEFLSVLHTKFNGRRLELLKARKGRTRFDFLPESAPLRTEDWKISPVPDVLLDRRVEITGPTDPKMVINALNSGANVFMADFEDATAPSWSNLLIGQEALHAAVRGTLEYTSDTGKHYALKDKRAVLFVRPRGWHLPEAHVRVNGEEMSGALFDFGVFFFNNALDQLARGAGPFFYLPKLESHLEARLWNDVFEFAQKAVGIPRGTIKATVLIETLPAAFEMDEILFELKEHSAGLNCGRWDYIFSFIKKQPDVLLPDRVQLTMDKGFLRAYSQKLIQTCHRRGAFAMGGMAALIPVKDDPAANDAAMDRVRADKTREAKDGHDGTWVAHPGLVGLAKQIFDKHLTGKNQLKILRNDVVVTREDLLKVPEGTTTEAGLRTNIEIGIKYLEAWLRGQGCVPIHNLMEDAATAEISRAQVWQQVRHGLVSHEKLDQVMREECASLTGGKFSEARTLFRALSTAAEFEEFLTVPAYQRLIAGEP